MVFIGPKIINTTTIPNKIKKLFCFLSLRVLVMFGTLKGKKDIGYKGEEVLYF